MDRLRLRLLELGVLGVEGYCARLAANAGNGEVLRDFQAEAAAAMMFATAGFTVEMRDRPDLCITGYGQSIAAEVKHFRWKSQDAEDDATLRNCGDYLVEYGDTLRVEGCAAWEQVANVARRKAAQFTGHVPYLLVIQSSSLNCIDDVTVRTAANILAEEISADARSSLSVLNGIIFLARETRLEDGRNVHFFELPASRNPLPSAVRGTLERMRRWTW